MIYTSVLLYSTLCLHVPLPRGQHEYPPVNPSRPEHLPVVHINTVADSLGISSICWWRVQGKTYVWLSYGWKPDGPPRYARDSMYEAPGLWLCSSAMQGNVAT